MKKLKAMLVAVCLVLGIVAVGASTPARASTCYHYATASYQAGLGGYVITGNSAAGNLGVTLSGDTVKITARWNTPWFIAGEGFYIGAPWEFSEYGGSGISFLTGNDAAHRPSFVQIETAEGC